MPRNHLNPKTNPRKAFSRVSSSLTRALHSYFIQNELTSVFKLQIPYILKQKFAFNFQPASQGSRREKGTEERQQCRRTSSHKKNENKNDVYQGAVRKWRHESQLGTKPVRHSQKFKGPKAQFRWKARLDINWNPFPLQTFPKNSVKSTTTKQSKIKLARVTFGCDSSTATSTR